MRYCHPDSLLEARRSRFSETARRRAGYRREGGAHRRTGRRGANRYFVPVAYLDYGGESRVAAASRVDIRGKGPDAIADYTRGLAAKEIVVAADEGDDLPVTELLRCRAAGIRVSNYMDFIERQTKTLDPDAVEPNG